MAAKKLSCMLPPLCPCSATLAPGNGRSRARSTGCLLVGRGYVMDALSPLGMVSDNPSDFHTESGAEAQKDYFVQKDGVTFAGTHLLLDLWGASDLTDPELID